jgi:hypothetical protein
VVDISSEGLKITPMCIYSSTPYLDVFPPAQATTS